MSACSQSAADSGEQKLIDDSAIWCTGLFAAKSFLRAHREYIKANSKHAKLTELAEPLKSLKKFLKTNQLDVASSLDLLLFKVHFFEEAAKSDAMAPQ